MKLAVEMANIGDGSPEAVIRYCKDLGIEGISAGWSGVRGFQDKGYVEASEVKALRAQIEDAGLEFASMVAWLPLTIIAGDAEAKRLFDGLRKSMEAMAEAGPDTLVAFAPVRTDTPWDQLVSFYGQFMDLAEQGAIRVATHTHGILNNYEALTRLMEGAPSPYNGLCYCSGNIWHGHGEGMYDVTRKLGDKIFFVHIRNVKTGMGEKEFWLHEGDVDIPRVLQVLKEIGYDGFVRSEHLPTDRYRDHVPAVSGVSDVGSAWSTGYLRAIM
ncbi:MAG: mannonate dehydratase [Anaerolineae bacterium]|nr:mannonate dehydratase [Anaerolineae bacterium]